MGFASLIGNRAAATTRGSFNEWVAGVQIRTTVGTQRGQWYAVATDFSIAGMGDTRERACEDLAALVESYLRSFHDQGQNTELSWQPLGRIRKLRILLPLKHKTRLVLRPVVH